MASNVKGEAAGTHPKNEAELFTLASTRWLCIGQFPSVSFLHSSGVAFIAPLRYVVDIAFLNFKVLLLFLCCPNPFLAAPSASIWNIFIIELDRVAVAVILIIRISGQRTFGNLYPFYNTTLFLEGRNALLLPLSLDGVLGYLLFHFVICITQK